MFIKPMYVWRNRKCFGPYFELMRCDGTGKQVFVRYLGRGSEDLSGEQFTTSFNEAFRFLMLFRRTIMMKLNITESEFEDIIHQAKSDALIGFAHAMKKELAHKDFPAKITATDVKESHAI